MYCVSVLRAIHISFFLSRSEPSSPALSPIIILPLIPSNHFPRTSWPLQRTIIPHPTRLNQGKILWVLLFLCSHTTSPFICSPKGHLSRYFRVEDEKRDFDIRSNEYNFIISVTVHFPMSYDADTKIEANDHPNFCRNFIDYLRPTSAITNTTFSIHGCNYFSYGLLQSNWNIRIVHDSICTCQAIPLPTDYIEETLTRSSNRIDI